MASGPPSIVCAYEAYADVSMLLHDTSAESLLLTWCSTFSEMDPPITRLTRASAALLAKKQLPSPPPSASEGRVVAKRKIVTGRNRKVTENAPTARASRKGKKPESLKNDDVNELPHNLGRYSPIDKVQESTPTGVPPRKRRKRTPDVKREDRDGPGDVALAVGQSELLANFTPPEVSAGLKTKRARTNQYGLSPGETPFPDHLHPTPDECREVARLLSEVHGEVKAPATIPAPSLTVSGCGEVPSILDALIRTLLSAATTGANSSRAFKGLVDRFGLLEEGVGKGSVDWDKVRRADLADVFEAIKCGGLAAVKSKNIKAILELVYQRDVARLNGSAKAELNDQSLAGERSTEDASARRHVLSLDHLHALSSDEALNELIKFPGIGPKTASCVLLFCMQRPSFAVDTHVFRLCKWLGWVPEKATRNTTYSHCEVRVPNELKYELHQLFIKHGKTCPRCRAATGEGGEGWEAGCPIDHLVKRTGKRKGALAKGKRAPAKGRGRKKNKSDESEVSMTSESESEAEELDSAEESSS
jgi:endonuclease III